MAEISELYDLSRNHVNKIVHQLGKSGIIDTRRGKGGGFSLNSQPGQVNLGAVVRLLENSLDVIDRNQPPCRISPVCRLRGILSEATAAFLATLDGYTLADLVATNGPELVRILELE